MNCKGRFPDRSQRLKDMWSKSHGLCKAHNTEREDFSKIVMFDAKVDMMEFWVHR